MTEKRNVGKNQPPELLDDGEAIPRSVLNKHMRVVLDHLWGPTGSVFLHIILVVLLFRLVWDTAAPTPEVEVSLLELETHPIDELEEQVLDDIQDLMEVDNLVPQEMLSDERLPDPAEFDRMDPEMDVTALSVLPDFQSPLVLRDLYAMRTDDGRAAMLARHSHGWGRFTEPAVIKALEWLRRNNTKFDEQLRRYLFTAAPILAVEEAVEQAGEPAEESAEESGAAPAAEAASAGSQAASADGSLGIGTLNVTARGPGRHR